MIYGALIISVIFNGYMMHATNQMLSQAEDSTALLTRVKPLLVDLNIRIKKEREELTKDIARLQVQLEQFDTPNHRHNKGE
jgi:hypothetical protein